MFLNVAFINKLIKKWNGSNRILKTKAEVRPPIIL